MKPPEIYCAKRPCPPIQLAQMPSIGKVFLGDPRTSFLLKDRDDVDIQDLVPLLHHLGIKPGSICIDVGAYIGDTAWPMLKHGCIVHAFEPFLDAFLCLLFNTYEFCPNVRCYNYAVGNGEVVDFDYRYGDSDCGCRYTLESPSGVQTVRLDDFDFDTVDFLKIDCEGRELAVLEGARKLIAKFKPFMHIESFPTGLALHGKTIQHLHDLIYDLGYEIYKEHDVMPKGETYESVRNLICKPI